MEKIVHQKIREAGLNTLGCAIHLFRRRMGWNQKQFYNAYGGFCKVGYLGKTMENQALKAFPAPFIENFIRPHCSAENYKKLVAFKPKLNELLYLLRIHHGINQSDVAQQVDCSRQWLNCYENGRIEEYSEPWHKMTNKLIENYVKTL